MTVRYKRCLISELKPGMMLGTDVLSARGKVMLSANTVLTENKIRRLSLWGYDSVIVLVDDAVGNQDIIHFSREALNLLGVRYFEAFCDIAGQR